MGVFRDCARTCLAAAEETALLSSRSRSSASAPGVTGLAAPRREEKSTSYISRHWLAPRIQTLTLVCLINHTQG